MPLTTRLAQVEDYPTFTALFPELGVPDPLPTLNQFTQRMLPRVVLALEDELPVGYAFFLVYGSTVHVGHVVVARAYRGRRIGEALLADVHARARDEGGVRLYLNVKKENHAAMRLYARSGFKEESSSWALRFAWSQLTRLPRFEGAVPFVPDVADDAEIASRFPIEAARIALLRERQGTALVGLRERGETVAIACFDPAYPGVYPFRAVRPDLARALLEALEPLADARFDFVHLTIEEDRALAWRLVEVGAEVSYELYRMGRAV